VETYCEGKKIYVKGQREKWTNVYLKSKGVSSWYDLTYEQKEELKGYLDRNCKSIWLHNGASNLDELKERVKGYYLRREQKDFGKIVKKTVKLLEYDLTDAQRVDYEAEYDAFVERQKESGNNGSTSLMIEGVAMRQWLAKEMIPHTKKLADYHLSRGEKVIIFCSFDNELYQLRDIYKDCCATFNGKMSPKEKIKAENDFMNNSECKVMVANIESCGVGLTLTSSNVCIFNNFSWQSGNNEQAEDRIYRLSQTKDVVIYYQLFKDTFFEKMFRKVKQKEDVINQIIVNEKFK
jgi:SNF2 family DNA or RNA helicase